MRSQYNISIFILGDENIISYSSAVSSKEPGSENVRVQVVQGDITEESAHAIINAANTSLMHNGGVAYAIRQRGGILIQEESLKYIKEHGQLKVGDAILAKPRDLNCFHLIHAVVPYGVKTATKKI